MSLKELVGNGKPLQINRMENFPIDNAIGEDIDVGQLVQSHSRRKEQRQQVYEMVYRKCCHRIRYANDVQYVKECYFRVPEIQLWNGIPRYEIKAVIAYVMIKLKQKGFDVKFQPPDGVMVNWERLVAKQAKTANVPAEIRFPVDEITTKAKPLDQMATVAERLMKLPCKSDCCSGPDSMPGGALKVSREARLEEERKRQQEEIDKLISRRDRTKA
jgi:hypothetical protein